MYGKLEENKCVKVLKETIPVRVLEGEEENDYLTKAEERMDANIKSNKVELLKLFLIVECSTNGIFFYHSKFLGEWWARTRPRSWTWAWR